MARRDGLHIVMFPWLAFGHMIPFLELSKGLAKKGHHISFISTPRNIERLPKLPPNLSHLINFVKLTLPPVTNLLEGAESTSDLPFDKIQYLKKAFDGLEGSFDSFLERSPPDLIIHDFSHHWLQPLASKYGVPCAYFSIFIASTLVFFGSPWLRMAGEDTRTDPKHFTVTPKWVPSPSNLAFRLYEILKFSESLIENASGVSVMDQMDAAILGSAFVVVRSCEESKGDSEDQEDTLDGKDDEWGNIKKWLDKKREGSVVYVVSGLPFFWALRNPPGFLPSGFEGRIQGRGFICLGWAPQRKLLGHPSVGVFLTHCGCSSVIEALAIGCPLVYLPLSIDQPLVARLLLSKNVGVEIPRDERDGSFTRDSASKSLRRVIVDKKGEPHKAKAREMKELFGDKARPDRYIDDFDHYLRSNHGC